ncbi:MAG TPA: hypothetical protein VM120_28275 [Bryobacteraceae bacterium]|nr:hypothetical protein [Bryobacteraceae bacterium]
MAGKDKSAKELTWEDLARGPYDPPILDLPFPPTTDEALLRAAVEKVVAAKYPKRASKTNRAAG